MVPRSVIDAHRNVDILVDVEGRGEPLREYVDDVVVGEGAVVKLDPKRIQPLLRLDGVVSIGSMIEEAFELQLPYPSPFWPRLELGVYIVANAIGALKKTDRRVEVRTNLPMLRLQVDPGGLEVQVCTHVRLTTGKAGRP